MNTILAHRIEHSRPVESSADAGRLLPAGLFALALAVNFLGIGWGLPNGNETWANDAIQPGAPLSVLYRVLVADPWNSGWFWFKYPMGHVLVLGAVYAPYLAWLMLTGGLSNPTAEYPHGFVDPEAAFTTLALLGRSVSAMMGALCALIAYFALVRSFGRRAALAGGLATALCYPLVFYSHTSNVEVPYVFWMMVAFLAAVRLVEGSMERRWWILLGVGAAMSVATKELGAGFFLAIPPVVLIAARVHRAPLRDVVRGGFIAAVATIVVFLVANNALLNPLGLARRVGFLTQSLEPEVALQYAPYYFPIDLGTGKGAAGEIQQATKAGVRVLESLGIPTAIMAVFGLLIAARRRPLWALLTLGCGLMFYLLGARAMLSLSIRYMLPISVLAAMLAGITIGALLETRRVPALARAAAAAALLWIAVYGADVNRMLLDDARYDAERWLAANTRPGDTVEVYQRPTYLPRFPARMTVAAVPFEERTIEGLQSRRPRFVVLSSAGLSGVSVSYRKDWKSEDADQLADDGGGDDDEWMPSQIAPGGAVMNYKRRDNAELLTALTEEKLGYRRVASFELDPWINRTLIQSLNPIISIYERTDGDSGAVGDAHKDASATEDDDRLRSLAVCP